MDAVVQAGSGNDSNYVAICLTPGVTAPTLRPADRGMLKSIFIR
jgi:hypothetical protein